MAREAEVTFASWNLNKTNCFHDCNIDLTHYGCEIIGLQESNYIPEIDFNAAGYLDTRWLDTVTGARGSAAILIKKHTLGSWHFSL